jgi:hypothetical protein
MVVDVLRRRLIGLLGIRKKITNAGISKHGEKSFGGIKLRK